MATQMIAFSWALIADFDWIIYDDLRCTRCSFAPGDDDSSMQGNELCADLVAFDLLNEDKMVCLRLCLVCWSELDRLELPHEIYVEVAGDWRGFDLGLEEWVG